MKYTCAITGNKCPYEFDESNEKPCNTKCKVGKEWLEKNNGIVLHDDI